MLKKRNITVAIAISSFLTFAHSNIALSSVYVCKDSHGNVLYTDAPEKNIDCVSPVKKEIPPLPSYNSKDAAPSGSAEAPSSAKPSPDTVIITNPEKNAVTNKPVATITSGNYDVDNNYRSLTVTSPTNGEVVNRCGGVLDVSFSSEPALYEGDVAKLYLDGAPVGTSTGNSFSIPNVERGDNHMLVVKITRNEAIIESSPTVGFTFLRNCIQKVRNN